MWIDTHAHLGSLSDDHLQHACDEARQNGVTRIVNTATSLDDSRTVARQCAQDAILCGTAGISPFDVCDLPQDWQRHLDRLVREPGIVAVGECGLDASNPRYPSLEAQAGVFEAQVACAVSHDKPLIIHSRGAIRQVLERCRADNVKKALFHCFTGTLEELRLVLDAGYHVSFAGIITFSSSNLDECVRNTPVDRLFVETDTPYLAPVPHRGKPNRPAWVRYTGEKAARLKECDPLELSAQIQTSFNTLFNQAS